MKKKIVAFTLVIAMLAICFGATLAYFTDTDEATNVFAIGNIAIDQNEWERDGEEIVEFTQEKNVVPAVLKYLTKSDVTVDGYTFKIRSLEGNYIDKIVNVTNTGSNLAYVRTIIAIEDPFTINAISINANDTNGVTQTNPKWITVEIGGTTYSVSAFTYNEALGKGQTTVPSLLQAYLKSVVTEEDCAALNGTWEILALSQAVQTAGWEAAEGKTVAQTALDTAFGEVNAANVAEWVK